MNTEYQPEDFYSLPPALRRKLFSNLERFRLEQIRLAQSTTTATTTTYEDNRNYRPCPISSTVPTSGVKTYKPSRAALKTRPRRRKHYNAKHNRSLSLNDKEKKILPRILQKPKSLQTAYLTARADSQWFQSLPSKVQQQHFSIDEQIRLGGWRNSVIVDAADRALYKLGHQTEGSIDSISSASTLSRSSSLTMTSDPFADSAIDMDDSFHDSFRWLDDEDDIDLTLDYYHAHLADTSVKTSNYTSHKSPHRRKPSFRRTFSFATAQRDQYTLPYKQPTTSQSYNNPSSSPDGTAAATSRHNRSFSRPIPNNHGLRHLPQSSVSSLDHRAQYYQDPEARLKLRVYLASPQKFDEAIEFGFPSIEHRENVCPRLSLDQKWNLHETTSTFLDNDSCSSLDEKVSHQDYSPLKPVPFTECWNDTPNIDSKLSNIPADRPTRALKPLPVANTQNLVGNREMTLKMTLTRADLRTTDDNSDVASPKNSDPNDPLRLAELPVADETSPIWETPEQKGVVKKIWRRFRGRCG